MAGGDGGAESMDSFFSLNDAGTYPLNCFALLSLAEVREGVGDAIL